MTDKAERMRRKFDKLVHVPNHILCMPVAPDSLAARIAEKEGFECINSAGYATNASNLACPDRGFADFGIMLNKCREIVNAVDIPVFTDSDTGYGDAANIKRTVRSFEAIGATGLFIEDQTWPKRCGHMANKSVVSTDEMVYRLKAALSARKHRNFLIMARTDARAVYDLDEAIRRAKVYRQTGADMVFIEAPQSVDELKKIAAAFPDTPVLANMLEGGKTPIVSIEDLRKMGFSLTAHPTALTYGQAYADKEIIDDLLKHGSTKDTQDRMITFTKFNEFVGLDRVNERENMYKPDQMEKKIAQWQTEGAF